MSSTRAKSIGANALSNLVGYVFLTLIALLCTPIFIRLIGEARYGVLALIWLLFGYFGVFDLGLSRATSNTLAKISNFSSEERGIVFWTGLSSNLCLGILGAIVFLLIGKELMSFYIKVPDTLTTEIEHGLPWVALLIPLSTMNGVFVATLEASEQFFKLNVLQTIGSTIFQILPLIAVITVDSRIDTVIMASAIGRVIAVSLIAVSALQIIGLKNSFRIDSIVARRLFRYGGWVTIFSIVGPIIVTVDQFVIGTLIGTQAVAYYSVSYLVASRANILPLSLSRALFPRLSRHMLEKARGLTTHAVDLLANTTVGFYLGAIFLSRPALEVWLGKEFAWHAAPVMEVLLVGIWFNGLAYIPFTMTQAQGRPDLVAKISLLELFPYLGLLWILITSLGLRGAAIAWALRAAIDAMIQFKIAGLHITEMRRLLGSILLLILALIVTETVTLSFSLSLGIGFVCLLFASSQILRNPTTQIYARLVLEKIVSMASVIFSSRSN